MPRRILKKILPNRHTLSQRWYLRPFGALLKDPVYWSVHRKGVLKAFALGLFICFIPLPIHLLVPPIAAFALRANVPVTMITLFVTNPLTYVPTFFTVYWVGAQLMGIPMAPFHFSLEWEWVETQLLQIWKPLLLGCFVTAVLTAGTGYLLL